MSYTSTTGLNNKIMNEQIKRNEVTILKLRRENAALKETIRIKEAAENPYEMR
jgi:hypothetical protein